MIEFKLPVDKSFTTQERIDKYVEIFTILIEKGALDGIRGGSAIIHFDSDGVFQGVELDYWPWRRRKKLQ